MLELKFLWLLIKRKLVSIGKYARICTIFSNLMKWVFDINDYTLATLISLSCLVFSWWSVMLHYSIWISCCLFIYIWRCLLTKYLFIIFSVSFWLFTLWSLTLNTVIQQLKILWLQPECLILELLNFNSLKLPNKYWEQLLSLFMY